MDNIIGPQGTQKPPKGVKCWWTAADYEKAYIKEHYVAEISLLKAKLKREGVPNKNWHQSEIVSIKKFGGQFISSYELRLQPRIDLTRKDKIVYLPIEVHSIYKDDSWWVSQIILIVKKRMAGFKDEQTRRKNRQLRKIYECDGDVTIP